MKQNKFKKWQGRGYSGLARVLAVLVLLTTAATSLWAQTYKVKMKNGTPDVSNWTITPPEASTTGVTVGSRVEVKYSGERRVKRALAKYKDAEGHALESAAVGELICSDGLAYAAADKKRLPTGVTAAALIVSMNGSHGLNVNQLAQALGTNRTYLSQYFSSQNTTYNAYINKLRIDHFCRLYQEAVADEHNPTAQHLVGRCGYRSYSTFSLAFKQRMGQSVASWMRENTK